MKLTAEASGMLSHLLAVGFFLVSFFFVYRSFYGMRIVKEGPGVRHMAVD